MVDALMVDHVTALIREGNIETNKVTDEKAAECAEMCEMLVQEKRKMSFEFKRIILSHVTSVCKIRHWLSDKHLQ
jgi:ribosomal protein L17